MHARRRTADKSEHTGRLRDHILAEDTDESGPARAASGDVVRCNKNHPVKRFNPRRVKIHRSYTVGEAATLFGAHANTVRAWLKAGLEPIDQRRPVLIQGQQLASFLQARRELRRKPCRVGEFYCLRCRMPKTAAAGKAEYLPLTAQTGNLKATCSGCGTGMYRRVAWRTLATVAANLQVTLSEGGQRLTDNPCHSLNSDLAQEASTHANTQSGK